MLQIIIVLVVVLRLVLGMLLNNEYEDEMDNLTGYHLKSETPLRDYSASPTV